MIRLQHQGLPAVALASVLAAFLLLSGGCQASSTSRDSSSTSTPSSPSSPVTGSTSPSAADEVALEGLWREFDAAVDVRPHIERPPLHVAHFSDAELAAFVANVQRIMDRSVAPGLRGKSADQAVRYVLRGEYPDSVNETETQASTREGGYPWQWLYASLFDSPPTGPRVLTARWQVSTKTGTLDDGTKAPLLYVTLQSIIVQRVRDESGVLRPIAVRRTVTVYGYHPLGGAEFWPGIDVYTNPYGNEGCNFRTGDTLVPLEKPDVLRTDLAALRIALSAHAVVAVAPSGGPSAKSTKQWLRRCSAPSH